MKCHRRASTSHTLTFSSLSTPAGIMLECQQFYHKKLQTSHVVMLRRSPRQINKFPLSQQRRILTFFHIISQQEFHFYPTHSNNRNFKTSINQATGKTGQRSISKTDHQFCTISLRDSSPSTHPQRIDLTTSISRPTCRPPINPSANPFPQAP
jgi:hypothetical protein